MPNFTEATLVNDHYIVADELNIKPKKLTGSRIGKALKLNPWGTPFQAWCEILRVAEPPFKGNKYTQAGEMIEPKLVEWSKSQLSPYIQSPEEYYQTADAKRHTGYDFFSENAVFGGMWDALAFDKDGVTYGGDDKPLAVVECKTTSRPQDWEVKVPDNYAVQGLLYAYLLGAPQVFFPVAFLSPNDYDNPENFVCTDKNTRGFLLDVDTYTINGKSIQDLVEEALEWWKVYIEDGVESPPFDERKDAEYVSIIHQCSLSDIVTIEDDCDLDTLLKLMNEKEISIKSLEESSGINGLKAEYKKLNTKVQAIVKESLSNIKGKDSLDTEYYTFKVGQARSVDYKALMSLGDDIYNKCVKLTTKIQTKRKA